MFLIAFAVLAVANSFGLIPSFMTEPIGNTSRGCLVCGRENPQGLHLHLDVDEETGVVRCEFTPLGTHIGFEGVVHGGILATVLDEAMERKRPLKARLREDAGESIRSAKVRK